MAKSILTGLDLSALPSLTTPKTGSVGFGAKADGLYQKIGTIETKLSVDGHVHSAVTTSVDGFMSAVDKVKLNGIATGANNYVHPSAHPISFITGLQSALDGKSATSHTHTFASLTNKPTTLSGFGITDAYTKVEVNSLASYKGVYSATNGFLVKTSIARTENSMLVLHIRGNSYGGFVPINTFVQVYNYVSSDAIIQTGALNNGYKINEVKAFYYNNLVYFWVPQQSASQTMTFQLLKATEQVNRVDSVTNAAVPASGVEKMVTIIPRTAWFEDTLTNLSQLTDNIGVATHIANKNNPHAVTTAQIGAVDLTTNQTIGGVKTFTSNVGIGTTAPSALLEIAKSASGNSPLFKVANTLNTGASVFAMYNNQGNNIAIQMSGSAYAASDYYNKAWIITNGSNVTALNFMTNGSQQKSGTTPMHFIAGGYSYAPTMVITPGNTGRVGIGTTTPTYKLDVSGTGRFTGNLTAPTGVFSSTVQSPKIDLGNGWDIRAVGSELQFFYNGVKKGGFSTNGFYSTGEVTAFN